MKKEEGTVISTETVGTNFRVLFKREGDKPPASLEIGDDCPFKPAFVKAVAPGKAISVRRTDAGALDTVTVGRGVFSFSPPG
jgi:hypothetical protein